MTDDDKELKDQRVVTMMSPSELEAIDDWMFKNRIRSRGEAIRRLCQMALAYDQRIDDFAKLVDGLDGQIDEIKDIMERMRPGGTVANLSHRDAVVAAGELLKHCVQQLHAAMEIKVEFAKIQGSSTPFRSAARIPEIQSFIAETLRQLDDEQPSRPGKKPDE